MSTQRKQAAKEAASKAEKIASKRENIRERTRKTFAEAMSSRKLNFDAVSDIAGSMVDGATQAIKDATPKEKSSVLKQVIDGLADGVSGSANATRQALRDATRRGERFVKDDVRRVTDNLHVLEEVFFETVSNAVDRAQNQIGAQASDLQKHARQAASKMRPALEKAIHAAMDHPVELVTETASTGVKAAPRAAGALLQAMSGLLAGAGDALTGKKPTRRVASRSRRNKATKKKAAKKKAAKKKSAKKKSAKKRSAKKKASKKKSVNKKAAKKTVAKKKTAKRRVKKKA